MFVVLYSSDLFVLLPSGSPSSHCHRLLHNYSLLRFSVSKPRISTTFHYFHCTYAPISVGIMYAHLRFSARRKGGGGGANSCQIIKLLLLQCRVSADRNNMDFDIYVYEAGKSYQTPAGDFFCVGQIPWQQVTNFKVIKK